MKNKTINSYRALADQKQYLKLIGANVLNRFADSLDSIAFTWLVYEITGNASLMALLVGLNMLPTILLQPFTGALVETLRKKWVMALCDAGRVVVVLAVAFLYFTGRATAGLLIANTILISTLEAFRQPAGAAIVPKLLSAEKYTLGLSLNATLSQVSQFVGTALAGVLVALMGAGSALFLDAGMFLLSGILIVFLRVKEELTHEKRNAKKVWDAFGEGLRYLFGKPLLMALMGLGMLLNFALAPFSALGVVYIAEVLGAGPEMLSIAQLSLTAGTALGSFLAPKLDKISKQKKIIWFGLVLGVVVAAQLPLSWLPWQWLRVALLPVLLIGMGGSVGVLSIVFSASLMTHTDEAYLSRINGLCGSVLCAAIPVSSFLCSALAGMVSVPWVLMISGILCMVFTTLLGRQSVFGEM